MNQANQNLLHPSRQVGADLAAWRKVGGGEGLLAALADPQSIVSKLQDANLCGMGGAGFPTWRKWEAAVAAQSNHGDKYVVCNANEDEPGTFKDRVLLAKTPHQVIEGVLIAAVACRANKAIMYVNPHQTESIAAIVPAIEQWKKSDLFIRIENYLGKPLDLKLVETSGRYIGGEETRNLRQHPANPCQRRGMVQIAGFGRCRRHETLLAFRRRIESGPVRTADGHNLAIADFRPRRRYARGPHV